MGAFASAEIILRLEQRLNFGEVTVEKSSAFYIQESTKLRLPKPHATMGKISFNSLGFRGPELSSEVDKIRIGFLGSSITFDPYVFDEAMTWPAVATTNLQNAFPGCSFEYFNAGVPGTGTEKVLLHYKANVAKINADLVVLMTDDSNGVFNDLAKRQGVSLTKHSKKSILAQYSLFWEKLEKNMDVEREKRLLVNKKSALTYTEDSVTEFYRATMANLINEIKNDDALPVILGYGQQYRPNNNESIDALATAVYYMPYMAKDDFNVISTFYNNANQQLAEKLNVPFIPWEYGVEGSAENFKDSRHFSQQGSLMLGRLIASQLIGNQQFLDKVGECATNG